jgi:starch synthase
MAGKAVCKRELQRRLGLEEAPAVPVVGLVSRLAEQKGLNLLADVIEEVVRDMVVQFALLGSGDKELEVFFGGLPDRYPGRIGGHIGYSNELAHWIEAGSDFFVMPSLYEPCGLNQIYSLRYGTLPIVRATGGLDDTVEQYDEITGAGTGFKFWDPTPRALYDTLGWAVSTYFDRKHHLASLIQRAMSRRFFWDDSAQDYSRAYEKAIEVKRSR